MATTGRKLKLTPKLQAAICAQLRKCGTLEDAAAKAGVGRSTLFAWRSKGAAQKRGPFRDFLDATDRALQQRRLKREETLVKHGNEDWRALAWLMERTEPKRYAPRVRVHVEEELTDAIQRLTEAFAGEPEILERALDALAGSDRSAEAEPDAEGPGGPDNPGRQAVQPAPAG